MTIPIHVDWWPGRALTRHPVRELFVGGHKLHPPMFSHVVTFPRLEIPLAGCYENQIDRDGRLETIRLRPGTALLLPPNCWNLPLWRQKVSLMAILFGRKQLGISLVSAPGGANPQMLVNKCSLPRPVTGPLPHVLAAMLELAASHDAGGLLPGLTRVLLPCVHALVREGAGEEITGRAQGLLERACVFLQGHYQYDITRESVARQFGVTPNHLSRLFQTHGSMTFSNYLTHVRIDRAKHLLCNYDLKLDEIAARCGYCDTPYFCRVFKRLTKITPAEYRMRVRHDQEKHCVAAPPPA
jgi:AraC-like DNA-binding protein